VRAGAFTALVQLQKERAVPLIVKTLSANEALLRRAAVAAVTTVPGNAATKAFARELAAQTPEGKVALLGALATRGDAEGLTDMVNKLAADGDPALRQAAIKALAKLGNASSIPVLVAALKDNRADATKSMIELKAAGVMEALIKQFDAGDATVREGVLTVLADRRQVEALPALRKAASDNDTQIRRAAYRALGNLGTAQDLAQLTELLLAKKDGGEQDAIAQAMSAIGSRLPDQATRSEPVLAAMAKADAPAKVCLLSVLGTLGGDKALQAVRGALTGAGEVRKAAVRALADWRDAAPMADLLTVAKEEQEKSVQIIALRGYVKMVGTAGGNAGQKLQSYRDAMELATRPDEKKLVLTGLAEVNHVDSLKAVEPCLDDAALQREAYSAYEKIAEALARRQPAAAKEALQRVVDKAADNGLRNKAKAALDRIR
jgi:HEAT repeat protein